MTSKGFDRGVTPRRPGRKAPAARPDISTHDRITPPCACGLPLRNDDKTCPRCHRPTR